MAIIDLILRRRKKTPAVRPVYEVWRDGQMLLASPNPELAACRLLANAGVRGKVRFWRDGRPVSEFDLQRAATKRRYTPFPAGARACGVCAVALAAAA